MTREEFIAELGRRLAGRTVEIAYDDPQWTVDRIDSRTVGVDAGGYRFILDVEAVDETPDPLIALLDRPKMPDVPPGLTQGEAMQLERDAGVVDSWPVNETERQLRDAGIPIVPQSQTDAEVAEEVRHWDALDRDGRKRGRS
jgi:hypothetical protein